MGCQEVELASSKSLGANPAIDTIVRINALTDAQSRKNLYQSESTSNVERVAKVPKNTHAPGTSLI